MKGILIKIEDYLEKAKSKLSFLEKYHVLIALLFFALITIAFLFPLIRNITTNLNSSDPSLNTWIIDWNYKTILSGNFKGYFDSPIFYPYKQTFLFSETLIFLSLVSYPIFLLTKNLALTYNILVVSAYLFSALSTYALAYYYTKNKYLSFIAGLIYSFAPWRFGNYGHLQIISAYFLPLIALFTEKYMHKSTIKTSTILGLLLACTGLISLYQFTFAALAIIIIASLRIVQKYKEIDFIKLVRNTLPAIAIFGLILGPIYFNYYKFSRNYFVERDILSNAYYSADLIVSPITTPDSHPIYRELCNGFRLYAGRPDYPCHEVSMFTGIASTGLAFIAIFTLIKFKAGYVLAIRRDKQVLYFLVLTCAFFIFAMGPYLKVLGKTSPIPMPYYFFYYLVPLAQGLRVPARLKIFYTLFVGMLSATGALRLAQLVKSSAYKILIGGVILFALCIDLYPSGLPIEKVYNLNNPAYIYIKNNPDINNAIEIPIQAEEPGQNSYWTDPLLGQTIHGKTLVNGYSGYFPQGTNELVSFLQKDSYSTKSIEILSALNVDTIIVNKTKLGDDSALKFQDMDGLKRIYMNEDFDVYHINTTRNQISSIKLDVENVASEIAGNTVEISFEFKNGSDKIWVANPITPQNRYIAVTFENGAKCHSGYKMPLFVMSQSKATVKSTCKFDIMTRVTKPNLQSGDDVEVADQTTKEKYNLLLK